MKFHQESFIKNPNDGKRAFVADSVMKKQYLGEGSYGHVDEVAIRKGDHEKSFALKDYKISASNGGGSVSLEDAKMYAIRAYNHYLHAKESGLKVVPTLRISDDGTKFLTTLLTNENISLIDRGSSKKWESVTPVQNIDNITDIIAQLVDNATKASDAKIKVAWEAYAFVIDNNKSSHINFFLFDFDNVVWIEEQPPDTEINIFESNLRQAHDALEIFVEDYVVEENQEEIKKAIDNTFNSLVSKINKDKYIIQPGIPYNPSPWRNGVSPAL